MKSLEELRAIKEKMKEQVGLRGSVDSPIRIVVGMATCGIAAGARPVMTAISEELAKRKLNNIALTQTGCIGICQYEPIVEIHKDGEEKVTYVMMTPQKAKRIISEHVVNGNVVTEYTIGANLK